MKILKLLIAYVAILFTVNTVNAQSVTPVNQDPIYGGWMHSIMPQSGTFKGNVNLGGLPGVVRTVEVKPSTMPGDAWVPLNGLLAYIATSGVDQFLVSVAGLQGNYSWFDARITYTSGPNGWTQVIIVNSVRTRSVPQLYIEELNCIGYTLWVDTWVTRYNATDYNYQARMDLEYESSPGVWTVHTSHSISPAGAQVDGESIPVFLPGPPPMPSPLLCFRLRLWFRHWHQAGYSDFGWTLIAETSGNNCYEWAGISTGGVDDSGGLAPCELRMFPNPATDLVTVEGFQQRLPITVYSVDGQLIRPVSTSPSGDNVVVDVSDLSAGGYLLQQEGARPCRFVKQ